MFMVENWYNPMNGILNGRLADLSSPFTLVLMHPVVLSSFIAIMLGVMLYFGAKLADSTRNSVPIRFFAAICLLELLPWFDNMNVRIFGINYIVSSAMALAALWLFLNTDKIRKRWQTALTLMLSVLAGMMHEGLSVTMIVGMGCYLLLYPGLDNRKQWAIAVAFCVGSIFTVFSPAIWIRIHHMDITTNLLPMIMLAAGLSVTLLDIIILYMRGNKITRMQVKTMALYIGCSFSGCAVMYFTTQTYRSIWFGMTFIIIGSLWLISTICKKKALTHPRSTLQTVTFIAATYVLVQFAMTPVWAYRLKTQYDEILAKYLSSDDGVVQLNKIINRTDIPFWANLHITYFPYNAKYFSVPLRDYYRPGFKLPLIIERNVIEYGTERLQPLQDNLYLTKDGLVCTNIKKKIVSDEETVNVLFTDGTSATCWAFCENIVTASGDTLSFIPIGVPLHLKHKTIADIR